MVSRLGRGGGGTWAPGGRYRGTTTSTWTVTCPAPALGDGGTLTETRQAADLRW
ncbi:hypothetical protein [Streptomyces clavifer]|uniref:hypothetical protein n=1 Tax=Streptomyces clavifer TaxID=68188 RepID=UPI003678741A